jgi:hypothetical protein
MPYPCHIDLTKSGQAFTVGSLGRGTLTVTEAPPQQQASSPGLPTVGTNHLITATPPHYPHLLYPSYSRSCRICNLVLSTARPPTSADSSTSSHTPPAVSQLHLHLERQPPRTTPTPAIAQHPYIVLSTHPYPDTAPLRLLLSQGPGPHP